MKILHAVPGLSIADGSVDYGKLLGWIREHAGVV